jgi:integrase
MTTTAASVSNTTPPASRVGKPQHWPLADGLEDPALGLTEPQLRELLQPARLLPSDWSADTARRLASAVQRMLSVAIGDMQGRRTRWSAVSSAIASVMLTDIDVDLLSEEERAACGVDDADVVTDEPDDGWAGESAFELAEFADEFRALGVGWGTGPGAIRLLVEQAPSDGYRLPHIPNRGAGPRRRRRVVDTAAAPGWQPADDNGASLDLIWQQLYRGRLLPVAVCAAFAAPQRTVTIDVGGREEPFMVPSLWQVLATMIVEGPARVHERLRAFIDAEKRRDNGPRVNRPSGGPPTEATLRNRLDAVAFWMRLVHELHETDPGLLNAWAEAPRLDVDLTGAQQWSADRRAVPLAVYRRARATLTATVDGRRRNGRLSLDRHVFLMWRDLMLLCFAGETGARAGELAQIRPGDVTRTEIDGAHVPVVMLTPLKRGRHIRRRGRRVRTKAAAQPRPQPISQQTYSLVREWIELHELALDDTRSIWLSHKDGTGRLTAAGLSRRMSGSTDGTKALLPRLDGHGGYSMHSLRHLVETLSFSVGSRWLEANRTWQEIVSAQVFAASKTMNVMPLDAHGYKDYEANRDLWALRTAIGDPDQNVPGLLDIVGGAAGARRGWDIDAIRTAGKRLHKAKTELDIAQQQLNALRLNRDGLRLRVLPQQTITRATSDEDLSRKSDAEQAAELRALVELLLERDIARERHDLERDQLDAALEEAHQAVQQARSHHDQALSDLERIRATGRTWPLPDTVPTADELRRQRTESHPTAVALDEETWEQALDRAHVQINLHEDEDAEPPCPRVRDLLNMPEFAAVLGISDGALRKRLRGTSRPLFPLDGEDSPLLVVGDRDTSKLRFIDADKLPMQFLASLLPEQREMIEQLLTVPMGSTRWGGRTKAS